MKTIDEIIRLSKNPHYILSEEELVRLEEYREQQFATNKRHNVGFEKAEGSFKKHNVEIEEE